MTIFSASEEKWVENDILHAKMYFNMPYALRTAGGKVTTGSVDFEPNVIVDRELITGQNPRSDHSIAEKLIEALARFEAKADAPTDTTRTRYKTVKIDDLDIFYREAGPKYAPTLLLLHGFPTSSQMFRNLIPALADRYHIVAPDYPGYGYSSMPPRDQFAYTFDHLAQVIDRFTTTLGLSKYALYVQDYGAPIGYRLATAHPDRIAAIVVQNGNAYDEGLDNDFWKPIKEYWKDPTSKEKRDAIRGLVTYKATRWQY